MEDIDIIIGLMKKFTISKDTEIEEQEGGASAGGSGGATYPTVTKWETGLSRSVANTVDDKVTWSSLYKITRGKANTLL